MEARRALVREQDAALEASARADREREQRLQQEAAAREDLERAQERDRERLEALRRDAALGLPPKPTSGSYLTIRFLMPDGRRLQRNFRPTDDIQVVHDFLFVEGVNRANLFICHQSLPRRAADVSTALSGRSSLVMVRLADGKVL